MTFVLTNRKPEYDFQRHTVREDAPLNVMPIYQLISDANALLKIARDRLANDIVECGGVNSGQAWRLVRVVELDNASKLVENCI